MKFQTEPARHTVHYRDFEKFVKVQYLVDYDFLAVNGDRPGAHTFCVPDRYISMSDSAQIRLWLAGQYPLLSTRTLLQDMQKRHLIPVGTWQILVV